ncbi:MAG: biotin transporter BioY [Proteobacteria bacterium]|nr:biotin transporter BioY [Pseudomonadota bacterium]
MTTSRLSVSNRSLSFVAMFSALIAVLGLIPKIDLPFGVPITLQTLGVMIAGCLLGPRRAFCAVGLFLIGVALGLPLLSGGRGGVGVFVAPSAGFLIGWPFGAFVCGLLMRHMAQATGRGLVGAAFLAAFVGGVVVVYLFGILGLSWAAHLSLSQAALAASIFLPGDLLKCGVCAILVQNVRSGLPGWRIDQD